MRPGVILLATLLASPAASATCGGEWQAFLTDLRVEALGRGIDRAAVDAVIAQAKPSRSVLKQDRSQGTFRQSFLEFSGRAVSADRLQRAETMAGRHAATLDEATRRYGVPAEVILAFWAMETDYGAFMGNFPTISALATLAHDCRRPDLFRPQLFAAMELVARGDMRPDVTGAWAGEIGHVQMLPGDIVAFGIDADGDGHVRLKESAPDAILSAAALLASHGWRRDEPWLLEATAPADLDWSLAGFLGERPISAWRKLGVVPRAGSAPDALPAALILPMGHKGPKFLVFSNFTDVFLSWNQSLTNTLTAAYLATRIGGADRYLAGDPDPILAETDLLKLQALLAERGHDVGEIDGIIGAKTRAAVRTEQMRLGLPADAWPTRDLLDALTKGP